MTEVNPPQMIISVPVQTAVCPQRGPGVLWVGMGDQESVKGSYLPPTPTGDNATVPP